MNLDNKQIRQLEQAIDQSLGRLMEFGADAVRIFVTVSSVNRETQDYSLGAGNLNAQIGMVQGWLTLQKARCFFSAQRETDELFDDEDDDEWSGGFYV